MKDREKERQLNSIELDGDPEDLEGRLETMLEKRKEKEEYDELMKGVSKFRVMRRIFTEHICLCLYYL